MILIYCLSQKKVVIPNKNNYKINTINIIDRLIRSIGLYSTARLCYYASGRIMRLPKKQSAKGTRIIQLIQSGQYTPREIAALTSSHLSTIYRHYK